MSVIKHNKLEHVFTLDIKGRMAWVKYRMKDDIMYLIHAEVPFNLRGYGIGKELVLKTFEQLTEEGYKAVAVCSYVRAVARRSEKWNSIIG